MNDTQSELSAGGVVVYTGRQGWRMLIMKDKSGNWTFPKGRIEPGETPQEAAEREIAEEVGVKKLEMVAPLTPVSYWYFREGNIKKTVQYFVFRSKLIQKLDVQTEEGISEARWVSFDDASKMIGYPDTNPALINETRQALHR